MSAPKPSVQLYTLRDFIAEDLPGTIARVAQLGFTQVEPYDFVARADEFAAALAANNLTAPTAHAMMIGTDVRPVLEAAKMLGITNVIDPFSNPEEWGNKDAVAGFAAEINRISEEAKAYGITIGYHNHFWELSNQIDGQTAFDYFIGLLNPDVVLEVDTYWTEVGGVNAADYLRKHADRIVAIHVKDGKLGLEFPEIVEHQVPAGTGDVPVAAILAAAPQAIPVVEFDKFNGGDLFAAVAQSLAFINGNRA